MGRLIEDILDLSHVEAEPFEPVARAAQRRRAGGGEASEAFRRTGTGCRDRASTSWAKATSTIMGDVRQLESAIANLVDNAIKYTAEGRDGSGTVTVTARVRQPMRHHDHGGRRGHRYRTGAPGSHLRALLSRRSRDAVGTTGGTGLGLVDRASRGAQPRRLGLGRVAAR